jgi:hypothetical protein
MKKLSNRDWALALIIGGIFLIVGIAAGSIFKKPEIVTVENPVNIQLKKSNDSLEAVVAFRDSLVKENQKRQVLLDSVIIKNNRQLRKDYEKLKNFTPESRAHYIDSILKISGIRR